MSHSAQVFRVISHLRCHRITASSFNPMHGTLSSQFFLAITVTSCLSCCKAWVNPFHFICQVLFYYSFRQPEWLVTSVTRMYRLSLLIQYIDIISFSFPCDQSDQLLQLLATIFFNFPNLPHKSQLAYIFFIFRNLVYHNQGFHWDGNLLSVTFAFNCSGHFVWLFWFTHLIFS